MRLKVVFPVIFLLLFLIGCKPESKYPGFSSTYSGISYKLLTIGDGKYYPEQSDYVFVNCLFKDSKGNKIDDPLLNSISGFQTFQLKNDVDNASIEEAIGLLNAGDSALFMVPVENLLASATGISTSKKQANKSLKNKEVLIELKLIEVYKEKEYIRKLKEFEAWSKKDNYESSQLINYLKLNGIKEKPTPEGLFYIPTIEGNGSPAIRGHSVLVHYIGTFIDGKEFDNTYKRKQPLDFVLGQSDQVLKGMELGISKMKRGGKAKFILPSHLAFGKNGSSNGKIPPKTTVIFEVELLLVN